MSIGHKRITVKESKQVLQTSIVRIINIQFANSVVMSFSIRLRPRMPLCSLLFTHKYTDTQAKPRGGAYLCAQI